MWGIFQKRVTNWFSREAPPDLNYSKPAYFQRHCGRSAILLAPGPSLNQFGSQIRTLIRENDLIVFSANDCSLIVTPDYFGVTNQYRLRQWGPQQDIDTTKGLFSIHFTKKQIKKSFKGKYNTIVWKDHGDPDKPYANKEGVIYQSGPSGTLLIMVAYVMGIDQLFVAGLDGWSKLIKQNKDVHYRDGYLQGKEGHTLEDMHDKWNNWNEIQKRTLGGIQIWAKANSRKQFKIITPSEFSEHFDSSVLDI